MVGKLGNSVDTLDEPSRPDLTSPSFPCDIPPTEHSMTNRTLFTTTLLAAAIALAGCKPSTDAAAPGDAATPPPTVAPTTAEPAADEHATDVLREVDNADRTSTRLNSSH